MDAINIAAAAITSVAFLFALWTHSVSRRKEYSEQERIALQRERLRVAALTAAFGAELADLIVQRSKQDDVSVPELRGMARGTRGALILLVRQLEHEDHFLTSWEYGRLRTSHPPFKQNPPHDDPQT